MSSKWPYLLSSEETEAQRDEITCLIKILSLYKTKPRLATKSGFFLLLLPAWFENVKKHLEIPGMPTALPVEKARLQKDAVGLWVIVDFATGMFELSHSVSSNFLLLPSQLLVRRFVKVTSSS